MTVDQDCPIDRARLMRTFTEIGEIGRARDGGISRLCLTEPERDAHELVADWMRAAGMQVNHDAFGNTVGTRPGRLPGPAVGIGSHLDSVPRGGNFDGVAGVLTALEVMRAINDAKVSLEHPVRLIVFAAEEGARFGTPCLGSRAAFGHLSAVDLSLMHDRDGISLGQALERNGLDPGLVSSRQDWTRDLAVFAELHIEQGRVLEDAGETIGVVDWVAGNRRLRMRMEGQTDHSGATPMALRRDALLGGAALALETAAQARRRRGVVATTGEFTVHPNALTAVPGMVELGVDVRSADVLLQAQTAIRIEQAARGLCQSQNLKLTVEHISDSAPTMLPVWVQRIMTEVSRAVTGRSRVMTSGAGHDSQIVARNVPAGMFFIPCRKGISHDPAEYADPVHLETGAVALARTLYKLDHRLSALTVDSGAAELRKAT
jgi:allantoate deiminase